MYKMSSRMPNNTVRILGIDPGYDRLGIAVIEKGSKSKETALYSDCFMTSPKDSIYTRLHQIGKEIARIADEFKPDKAGLESLFITKNQKTAMRVAEARGIIAYELTKRNIPISEYSPMQIKMAVTGDGTSDKARMIKMVGLLVKMPKRKTQDDEYDAVAVAITCGAIIHS